MWTSLLLSSVLLAPPTAGLCPQSTDAVVLRIDGDDVSWPEFGAWLVRLRGESNVSDYLNAYLLERAAHAQGIELTDDDITKRLQDEIELRVNNAFAGDRNKWLEELARLDATEKSYLARRRARVRPQLLINRLAGARREITSQALRQLYERRYGKTGTEFDVELLRLRAIVPPGGRTIAERQERQTKAREKVRNDLLKLRERALAGEDFGALIAAHSEDPTTKGNGGKLPAGFRASRWPDEAVEMLLALEPGEISEPIFALGFYNLMRLVSATKVSFEEVEPSLRAELEAAPATSVESQEILLDLRSQAQFEVLPAMYSGSRDMSEAVLRIDDVAISRERYARWLAAVHASSSARSYVEEHLALQQAREVGISVTDEDVERRMDVELEATIERFFNGNRDEWLEDLEQRGRDEARERRDRTPRMRLDLIVERLLQKTRTFDEQQIRNRWEEIYGRGGRAYDVRILRNALEFPERGRELEPAEQRKLVERIVAETLARLAQIRERAQDGEDFATLVGLYSDHEATKSNGGRFQGRFPLEEWGEVVGAAIRELSPGEITEPMQLGSYCYIFELNGVRDVAFEDVRAEVLEGLKQSGSLAAERAGYLNLLQQNADWSLALDAIPAFDLRR